MIRALTGGSIANGARINRATALDLINRYMSNQHIALQNQTSRYDSVYVYFSLEQLKAFIEDMYANHADGLRVYFGAINNPSDIRYHLKQTVVFVPTKKIEGTSCHEEFIDNSDVTVAVGYNFGSLCPPECNHCACEEMSLAKEAYGKSPCDKS